MPLLQSVKDERDIQPFIDFFYIVLCGKNLLAI